MNQIVDNIEKVRSSIIAIGFRPNKEQITILGSGFSVGDGGEIISAAHLYKQLKPETKDLIGMVMDKKEESGLEHYTWLPLTKIDEDDHNDLSLLRIEGYKDTLLKKIELSNSDDVRVGQEAYFIGFPYAAQLINDGFGITLVANRTMVSNIKQDGVLDAHPRNWFIVDAISNPGNSGCPLIDSETNKVIGIMTISFRTQSKINPQLDIREPMHIAGAKPINLAKKLFPNKKLT